MQAKQILKHLGVKPSKDKGQNFLIEEYVIDQIIDFASLQGGTHNIIEIGPGLGMLTKELASLTDNFTAIEIEPKFQEYLAKVYPDINIIGEDVRFVDFSELGNNLVVLGNLPYSFSGEIINLMIAFAENIDRAVFMLQKEYVQRICSPTNQKSYGPLSVFVQSAAVCIPGPIFPPECFFPPPTIDSQVVELRLFKRSPAEQPESADFQLFFKQFVLALFKERRKKVVANVTKYLKFEKAIAERILSENGTPPESRADSVSVEQFRILAKAFYSQ